MEIACSIDKQYIPHMCAMLLSLYENTKVKKIGVHILHSDLTIVDQQVIKNTFNLYRGISISFYEVDNGIFEDFPIINKHIKIQSYYRLALASIIPVEKVFYIDSDMIINDDLTVIWETDISNYYVGAVVNLNNDAYQSLGLKSLDDYFNAGFLLINLSKWRKENIFESFLTYLNENQDKIKFEDQDTLNAVFNGKWKRIHPRWNVQNSIYYTEEIFLKYFDKATYEICLNQPSIIHYSGQVKPWQIGYEHPKEEEYYKYAGKLEWITKFPIDKDKYSQSGVYIFGTGEKAKFFTMKLKKQEIPIAGYLDNNPSKWGEEFLGKSIYELNQILSQSNTETIGIVIASMYFEEIIKDLKMKYSKNNFEILN